MSLRLLEIITPTDLASPVHQALEDMPVRGVWEDTIAGDLTLIRALLEKQNAEAVCDRLEERFAATDGFQVMLIPVEAAVPRGDAEPASAVAADGPPASAGMRISRAELLEDVDESLRSGRLHLTMAVLSTIVCGIGLLRDNMAILIGAMVIAPLLGPNVALALATTLGDLDLARRALRVGLTALVVSMGFSIVIGMMVAVDPTVQEIASRTEVDFADIALALAAGTAGALAFTSGVPSALIGVMVAVALLPPVAVVGLLVGSAQWHEAEGAVLLLLVNVTCVNLAGVVTFLIQGVRPRSWWEAARARRATWIAVAGWCVILVILAGLIILVRQRGAGLPA